jgi:hypothetical protein
LGIAEDAIERVRVRLFNFAHGALESIADVGGDGTHVVPVAVIRDLETVRLGNNASSASPVSATISSYSSSQTSQIRLKNSSGKDVGLEVGRIDRAAQDIGGLPEVGFKQGDGFLRQKR